MKKNIEELKLKVRDMLIYYEKGFGNKLQTLLVIAENYSLSKNREYINEFNQLKDNINGIYANICEDEIKQNKDLSSLIKTKKLISKLGELSEDFLKEPNDKNFESFYKVIKKIGEVNKPYFDKMLDYIKFINLNGDPEFSIIIVDYKNRIYPFGKFKK
jgi:hypothetical protein